MLKGTLNYNYYYGNIMTKHDFQNQFKPQQNFQTFLKLSELLLYFTIFSSLCPFDAYVCGIGLLTVWVRLINLNRTLG